MKAIQEHANHWSCKKRRRSRLDLVDRHGNLQTNERKCDKILKDEIGDVWSNQERQNCRSHPRINCKPRVPREKKENTNLETDDNARSFARVIGYQRVSESLKKLFEVEMEVVREQFNEIEVKLVRLNNKISLFKAKKQESS